MKNDVEMFDAVQRIFYRFFYELCDLGHNSTYLHGAEDIHRKWQFSQGTQKLFMDSFIAKLHSLLRSLLFLRREKVARFLLPGAR